MKHIETSEEFEKEMKAMFGPPSRKFRPAGAYIPSGDCLEVFIRPGAYRGKRIDDRLTIYYRRSDNAIAGFVIKGIRSLFKTWPGLRVEVHQGKVRPQHIVRAHVWSKPNGGDEVYQKLVEAAEETPAEADLVGAA